MNISELYNELSSRTGLTKKDCETVTKELINTIKEEVTAGGSISFMGFATFANKEVPDRDYRNPKTGETFTKPAHNEMTVKVSNKMKDI